MLRPGMFLQDRYEILEKIGSGGMSDVYKAKCHKLNRLVAIKVMKQEFSSDSNFVGKFKMEAQAAAGLSHPNIVNVYDVIDEEEIHYIVMELIEGITLKNYIAKKGCLGWKETIGIAIQVAQGMDAAHEQHIIHRDIKPQNMIISKDGKVKVADFGIARAVSAQTLSSTAMGSVHYISPEQAKGLYSDERSDIYSFGITMYEMVTGKVPFEGDNTVAVALAHLEDPITPPRQYNPNIPVGLENIIMKCTQKKPDQRYTSATEVICDLRKVLLNPKEEVANAASLQDHLGQTLIIGDREMEQIKERNRSNSQNSPKKQDQDENINPQLEKILTAVGIVAAILIVAVLIFIISKLGGVFNQGTSKTEQVEVTDISIEETLTGKQTRVPDDLLGLPVDAATAKLKEETLILKVVDYDYSEQYEEGEIMALAKENPAGSIVDKYSKVAVYVSKGSNSVDLASMSLIGMDCEVVKKILEGRNITFSITEEENPEVKKGSIIRYSPEKVNPGESVGLVVSTGVPVKLVDVPGLEGKTAADADAALEGAGLIKGKVTLVYSSSVSKGTVISQEVSANTKLEEGSAVNYTVSDGPEVSNLKYVSSIAEDYEMKSIFGPGSNSASIQIAIRLRQYVNGKDVSTTLMEPQTISGDQVLPVRFSGIEGADGVKDGFVEVINAVDGTVYKSYPITFVALPRT